MDFPTRNMYRSAVEDLAMGSNLSELEVARRAVQAGVEAAYKAPESDGRRADPGFHLCAGGRVEFETAIGFRAKPHVMLGRFYRALGIGGYVGAGVIVAALLLALPFIAHADANVDWIWLGILGTLGAVPALDAAVALVNQGFTYRFGATQLPGMELKDGVPKSLRTLVVVPVLLTTREALGELIERLEIHYLASQVGDLQFALLSDWTDASSETIKGDEELRGAAEKGIARLNHRHGPAPGATVSCYYTADACGMKVNADGSDGNANVASCTSSIGCYAALPTRLFYQPTATRRAFRRTSAMSSRSTQTLCFRATP